MLRSKWDLSMLGALADAWLFVRDIGSIVWILCLMRGVRSFTKERSTCARTSEGRSSYGL